MTMVGEAETHWQRLWRLRDEAVEQPTDSARSDFLDRLNESDPDMVVQVRRLLAVQGRISGFLARPPSVVIAARRGEESPDIEPPPSLTAGDAFIGREIAGRYTIESRIAAGGMGVVYSAMQRSPRKRIALKVMRAGSMDARALGRMRGEADALARLHHPGIAQVYESGTFDHGDGVHAFVAMELVAGPTLASEIVERLPPLSDRVAMLVDVCDAVEHAHQRGVIHCDLKPGNILIDKESGVTQPKVVDFGVSRIVGVDVTATFVNDMREMAGTLAYMSPERLASPNAEATIATDVFALGVIGYEMLCGKQPVKVEATSVLMAIQAYARAEPRRLGEHDRALRGDLETIIHKAMAREPRQRYRSAGELAADLRRWLTQEPIVARPASKAYQFRKFVQRNKALSIGVTIALAALLAGATVAAWQAVQARRSEAVAVARFEAVRTVARSLFDLYDAVAVLPGSTPARKRIIDQAMIYLTALRQEGVEDSTLLREMANAYERVGDIQGNVNFDNLGDMEAARDAYDQSLAIRQRLALEQPASRELQYELARIEIRCGQTSRSGEGGSNDPGPNRLFEAGLARLESIAANSTDPRLQCELACALSYGALEADDRELQWQRHARAIQILERLHKEAPDNLPIAEALGHARFWHGYSREVLEHDHQSAMTELSVALVLFEGALATEPRSPTLRHAIARTLCGQGIALAWLGRADQTVSTMGRAYEIALERSQEDPENQLAYRLVEVICSYAGDALESLANLPTTTASDREDRLQDALTWHQRSLAMTRERKRRGWISSVESDYETVIKRSCDRCIAELAALRGESGPPSHSTTAPAVEPIR